MKKILHLVKYYNPHIGGVETHLREVNKLLVKDYQVTVICFQDGQSQKLEEKVDKVNVIRIPIVSFRPKIIGNFANLNNYELISGNIFSKLFFKLKLWTWVTKNSKYFLEADIIQVHDVMWWVWPLYMAIYYKLYLTFHGWEGYYPVRMRDKIHRYYNSLAAKKSIHVGDFISQFYLDKPDYVIYGGVKIPKDNKEPRNKILSNNSTIVFLGRLEAENEIKKYLSLFKLIKNKFPKVKFKFVGDGSYRSDCETVGEVTGYVDNPTDYLSEVSLVCANSYLSILEAQSYSKVVCSFYSHLLKKSYLKNFPGAKLMVIESEPKEMFKKLLRLNKLDNNKLSKEIRSFAGEMTWEKVAKTYQVMWKI